VGVLTLVPAQPESLWDEALPVAMRELPADLAQLDVLPSDPGLLAPIVEHWRREVVETKRAVLTDGRPTIAMETYIRLMVLKARYRWGIGRWLRALTRTIRRRSGEAKVLRLTEQTGELLEQFARETRRLAVIARRRARGRGAKAKLKAAARIEELADRCDQVARQIRQRVAGEPIKDRLVSLADPDARPIRKGKLGKPNEFGYVTQLAEVTEHTKRGARGLIVPSTTAIGNPSEDTLLPRTVAELTRLGISPREVALDGGFNVGPTREALEDLAPERVFISGRQQLGSKVSFIDETAEKVDFAGRDPVDAEMRRPYGRSPGLRAAAETNLLPRNGPPDPAPDFFRLF
jgi:hypothetical protein